MPAANLKLRFTAWSGGKVVGLFPDGAETVLVGSGAKESASVKPRTGPEQAPVAVTRTLQAVTGPGGVQTPRRFTSYRYSPVGEAARNTEISTASSTFVYSMLAARRSLS